MKILKIKEKEIVFGLISAAADGCSNHSDYTQAYIRVKFVKTSKTDDDEGKLHPFRKAAFEYMKLQRPDLFFPNNFTNQNSNIGIQFISSILNVFTSAKNGVGKIIK